MGACHCCQTFWEPQCQRACGSERSSLETPHRSSATTLRFARWYRTWCYSQVVRKQRREPLCFRAALERHFDSDHRATADITKTLARNMDRAFVGDRNGRENLVNIFVVKVTISLPHRGGVRVVFSRTFLVHVWRKCRGADCFCRKMIYSTPRVDLFCALCTSWTVAEYRRLCW